MWCMSDPVGHGFRDMIDLMNFGLLSVMCQVKVIAFLLIVSFVLKEVRTSIRGVLMRETLARVRVVIRVHQGEVLVNSRQ